MPNCQGRQKFIIRTSDRGIFRSCRQRWNWASKMREDLEPKGSQRAFDFGTSIHSGLEAYYDPLGYDAGDISKAGMLYAFVKSEKDFFKKLEDPAPEMEEEFEERLILGTGMLKNYADWAPKQDENWIPRKVEIEFEVPIPAADSVFVYDKGNFMVNENGDLLCWCNHCYEFIPVVYQGRVDMVAENKRTGRLWVWDHKTAKQFGQTQWLDLDDQCGSYLWALKRQLNLDIDGVIYNRLRKDAPKPLKRLQSGGFSVNKQQLTTYDFYMRELKAANEPSGKYAEYLEYLKHQPNPFFQRIEVLRAPEELAILEHRILIEAIEMLDDPMIYPNPGMFNCMGCAYFTPCLATQDGSDPKMILEGNFVKRNNDDNSDGSIDTTDIGRTTGSVRL